MLLVVMTTLLALAQAGHECRFKCQPKNMDVVIAVESCNRSVSVSTTMCEGQCFLKDPNFIQHHRREKQTICNGDWYYERRNVEGCEVDVPVAQNCRCLSCDGEKTDCRHMSYDNYGCLP